MFQSCCSCGARARQLYVNIRLNKFLHFSCSKPRWKGERGYRACCTLLSEANFHNHIYQTNKNRDTVVYAQVLPERNTRLAGLQRELQCDTFRARGNDFQRRNSGTRRCHEVESVAVTRVNGGRARGGGECQSVTLRVKSDQELKFRSTGEGLHGTRHGANVPRGRRCAVDHRVSDCQRVKVLH